MFKALAMFVAFITSLTYAMNARASSEPKEHLFVVNGCSLLHAPAKFNGKLVKVEGTVLGAFENFRISFNCPGTLNLTQSLYESDIRKFGFRTIDNDQSKKLYSALFPKDNLERREAHTANVILIGRFRCHYDFPDCKNISIHGDSSIVIQQILSFSDVDAPATGATKE